MYDTELVDFKQITAFAKLQLESNCKGKTETNPVVVSEKGGRIELIVVCPVCDKDMALQATKVIIESASPDAVTLIYDSYYYQSDSKDSEEAVKKFREDYPGGLSQAFGRDPKVTQALVICRADNCANIMNLEVFNYKIVDGEIRWETSDNPASKEVSGALCKKIKEVMLASPILPNEVLQKLTKTFGYSKDDLAYHTARAGIGFLLTHGFQVVDFISMKRTDSAFNLLNKIYQHFVDSKIFSPNYEEQFIDFVRENLTSPDFIADFTNFVSTNKDHLFADDKAMVLEGDNFDQGVKFLAHCILEFSFSPLSHAMLGADIYEDLKKQGIDIKNLLNPDDEFGGDEFGGNEYGGDYPSWN